MRGDKLKEAGMKGREFILDPEIGMTASEMCRRFIHDMHQAWDNFKPRGRMTIDNASLWNPRKLEWNGLTVTKEI